MVHSVKASKWINFKRKNPSHNVLKCLVGAIRYHAVRVHVQKIRIRGRLK